MATGRLLGIDPAGQAVGLFGVLLGLGAAALALALGTVPNRSGPRGGHRHRRAARAVPPRSSCAAQGLSATAQYLDLPLKQAPGWSYRLAGNYSWDMSPRGVLSFGADFAAKDDHFNNLCASPGIRVKGHEILNAQLRWANESGKLQVTLSGSNPTDSEVFNGGFDFARSLGFAAGYLYPPRMWALSVRYGY